MQGVKPVTIVTALIGIMALSALWFATQLFAAQEGAGSSTSQPANNASASASRPASRPASQPTSCPASQPTSQPATAPQVIIETSLGRIVVELDAQRTPITTANFLAYVDDKFYDGLIFHRVIKGFMIQGGGFAPGGQQIRPKHPPIRNESKNSGKNQPYTIAMARTGDPNSATSQFFINVKDNVFLNYPNNNGYCVFGHVIEGKDVVDRIAAVQVAQSQISEAQPLKDVVIQSIRRK